MAVVLLPLVLTAITMVAVWRAYAQMADEADQLRSVLVRVRDLRPVVSELSDATRHLGAGVSRLGR